MTPNEYQISTYDYELLEDRIASVAAHPPESAKMLVLDRSSGNIIDTTFQNLPEMLDDSYFFVFNDSRVIPSRVALKDVSFIDPSGSERLRDGEIFFLGNLPSAISGPERFEAMIFPGKAFKVGTRVVFPDFELTVDGIIPDGRTFSIRSLQDWLLRDESVVSRFLATHGKLPLPPYIEYSDEKAKDYQTDFAKKDGSLAAPTASLHFTSSLIRSIQERGVTVRFLTLHVGLGTFQGMKAEDIREHHMHFESFEAPLRMFEEIATASLSGKKIVGVGTTVVRTLESLPYTWQQVRDCSAWSEEVRQFWDTASSDLPDAFVEGIEVSSESVSGRTRLFITPGYRFRVIREMVTNFHLPKSTLMVLVSSLAGIPWIQKVYQHALQNNYRFYSFGDGMWIRE